MTVCPVDGTLLAPSHDLVGRILGDRYRILSRLGQGGMGSIYLAEHVTLGKRMAVKVLRPEYSRDAELLDRFQHEARAASQIGQENIVEVFDFGHTPEGEAYFVMEALDGESLARILHRDGPMPLARAVPVFLQICRALGAAHQRGIVHRDLKPENVFVLRRNDGADFVKVLDFGIAKGPGTPDSKRLTKAGSIIGTPEYMSPEQASSNVIDQRSDVYAFGVLAYETLTGRLPFDGDTPLATLMKHQSDAPVPPRRLRPELPPEVEQIVLRALVKRPEGRQQSMEELSAELSRLAGADPEVLRAPVFGTAVSPLLTGRTTDRQGAPHELPRRDPAARRHAPAARPRAPGPGARPHAPLHQGPAGHALGGRGGLPPPVAVRARGGARAPLPGAPLRRRRGPGRAPGGRGHRRRAAAGERRRAPAARAARRPGHGLGTGPRSCRAGSPGPAGSRSRGLPGAARHPALRLGGGPPSAAAGALPAGPQPRRGWREGRERGEWRVRERPPRPVRPDRAVTDSLREGH